jgi:hypothetical protein
MSASVFKPKPASLDWNSIQAEEEAVAAASTEETDPNEKSRDADEEEEEEEEDGFEEVKASRKKRSAALGPKQDDHILLFQEAYSNPTYVYTKQIVRSYQDLERLYSKYNAKRCQQRGTVYEYEYYHGYSLDTQVVWSFHHGEMRAHKKLTGEELAAYLDKIRLCFDKYKRPCRSCQGPRHDLANNMSFCFACNTLRLK